MQSRESYKKEKMYTYMMKRACQYCGRTVIRQQRIPFATCRDCKTQRAIILRDFKKETEKLLLERKVKAKRK